MDNSGPPNRETGWILVVEDDQVLAEDISTMLTMHGFRVVRADKALDATTKLRNQKFACILLDLKLERGSGEEVLTSVRRSKRDPNYDTPVIITSGYLDADLVKRIGTMVTGILVKPFDSETLISRVRAALTSPNSRMA